jgi:hypothetical protein
VSIEHITRIKCDRCGASREHKRAMVAADNTDWGCVDIYRGAPDPSHDATGWTRYTLCDPCAAHVGREVRGENP